MIPLKIRGVNVIVSLPIPFWLEEQNEKQKNQNPAYTFVYFTETLVTANAVSATT